MENLIIQGTARTLDIKFEYSKGVLTLQGSSYSENAVEFFQPIMDWVAQYAKTPRPYTEVYFTIEYAATSSVKAMLELLKEVERIHIEGLSKVDVYWNYYEIDEDICELGEDYEAILDVPFHFVKMNLLPDLEILKQLKHNVGKDLLQTTLKEITAATSSAYVLNDEKQIIALNLYGIPSKFFPIEILELKNLEVLIITRTQIKRVPEEITSLSRLRYLELTNNRIADLPESLFSLNINWSKDFVIDEPMLRTPPLNVIREGKAAILTYYKSL